MEYLSENGQWVLDGSDYRMQGVHRFDVTVSKVEIDGTPVTTLKNYVYLQAGFYAERYYKLDTYAIPKASTQLISYDNTGEPTVVGTTSSTPSTDELFVNWNYIQGAEEYELEWTWVDNYAVTSLGTPLAPTALQLNESEFKHNSTRIRTGEQYYRIPNIFARGYVVYRVRAVGRWLDDPTKEKFGTWSTGIGAIYVSDWLGYVTITTEHEAGKNWQFQSTYAEQGKKKEVTQYFDGSLRTRQTVTRINSDNHSVVGETIYDNEGRGVIQVLPVPGENPAIKYYPSLNEVALGDPFSHQEFDWEDSTATCAPFPSAPLDQSKGAGNYYSALGYDPSTDSDWQQYVPESYGYAYTQVEYTPDNTGRIRNQSGVGIDHTIGSTHETKYFYLQPSQEELNRLFGYKVGYKTRYKKNMVVDANSQVSVSYLDAQGRVVATALSGSNQTDFKSLDSEISGNHQLTTTDLLNKLNPAHTDTDLDDNQLYTTSNFGVLQDGLKLETQLGVSQTTVYNFEYTILAGVYSENCQGVQGVSYPYVYDLVLSLRDDCGNEVFSDTTYEIGIASIGSAVNSAMQTITPGAAVLEQGSYTLVKTLKVNQAAFENYLAHYLSDANACLLTTNDFVPELATDPCPTTCQECVEELGTLSEFMTRWAQDSLGEFATLSSLSGTIDYYTRIYQGLKEKCLEGCAPRLSCDSYEGMMLGDVSPGGQYAGLASGTPGKVSVFTSGYWRGTDVMPAPFGTGSKNYLDELGNQVLISAYPIATEFVPNPANGSNSSYNLCQIDPIAGVAPEMVEPWQLRREDFITLFQPSWAEALLSHHPEYPLLEYAREICNKQWNIPTSGASIPVSSAHFDVMLREQITDYTLAGTNPYGIDFLTANPIFDQDPYFNQTYSIHTYSTSGTATDLTASKTALMSYALSTEYKNTGMTLFQLAVKTALYANNYNPSSVIPTQSWPSLTAAQKDQVWEKYKFYYLSYKAEIDQLLMDLHGYERAVVSSEGIYNGCIGENAALTIGTLFSFASSGVASTSGYGPIVDVWSDLWGLFLPPFNLPGGFCGTEFDDKVARIVRHDVLYNAAMSQEEIIAQGMLDADYAQWEQTGLCPLTVDVERLLDALSAKVDQTGAITQASRFTASFDQTTLYELVPDLYQAFTGVNVYTATGALPNMTITGTSPSGLNINFSAGAPVNTSSNLIISNLTNNAGVTQLSWTDYGTTWEVFGVSQSFPTSGANSETKVIFLAGATFASAREYIATYTITGAAKSPFTDCSALKNPANDPDCQKEEDLEADLLNILQGVHATGDIASTVDITTESYYQGTTLSELLNISGTVNWSPMSASNFFYIGNSSNQIGVSLTAPFPVGNFFFTGVNITLTAQTAINGSGGITLAYIDDNGIAQTLKGGYFYKQNAVHAPLRLDCPCPAGSIVEYINGITYQMLSNRIIDDGTQLSSLAGTPYLESIDPLVMNWSTTEDGVSFNVFQAGDCDVENSPISCSGEPCRFTLTYPNGDRPESPFTVASTEYLGAGMFSLIVEGTPVVLEIECYDAPVCDDCTPDGKLQSPIACNEAYTDYKTAMSTHFAVAAYSPSSEEYLVFESEHLIDEQTFCGSAYAYITAAYINYLINVPSTGIDQPNYLSISEFGATELGYSNELLDPVITSYINSGRAIPTAVNYITWNEYVSEYLLYTPGICPAAMPDPYIKLPELAQAPCNQWEDNISAVNTQNQHTIYLNQMAQAFTQAYVEGAMSSVVETFGENHKDKEYHYTLYYYDRAGNLIQTVPPKGVNRFEYGANGAPLTDANGNTPRSHAQLNAIRLNNPTLILNEDTAGVLAAPEHTFATSYLYNSLNQLVYQQTPDGGQSRFAYDKLGRLVASQNASQLTDHQFSYTLYDGLGRVIEVGEMTTSPNLVFIDQQGHLRYNSSPNNPFDVNSLNWINAASTSEITARNEVTRTIYDRLSGIAVTYNSGTQLSAAYSSALITSLFGPAYAADNTRNRIVGVIYQEDYDPSLSNYQSGTFYDYDVHGNVKQLIQVSNFAALVLRNRHIKHLEYTYDLVSGNVEKVIYQRDQQDQFMHRYSYDSDNRITIAETSKDGIIWEKDAKYFYYDHGPLARTELGEKKVQAVDYAYTIQGWLKTVNGEQISPLAMMGQDGQNGTLNSQNARDAFGFSLSYFNNDYAAYSSDNINTLSFGVAAPTPNFYNGNIRTMYTALSDLNEAALAPHQTDYSYDQLNRIKSMDGTLHIPGMSPIASGYSSMYSFDANGNLQSLKRYAPGDATPVLMDDFTYDYTSGNNQLESVNDAVTTTAGLGLGDIQNGQDNALAQGGPNYQYDAIGQLIKDKQEKIVSIDWKVTNKVEQINFDMDQDDVIDKTIHFDYDPMGNRIAKQVTENGLVTSTFYTLDAQSNVMSIYGFVNDGESALLLKERNIYGSSRLGVEYVDEAMSFRTLSQTVTKDDSYIQKNYVGDKRYELSNHLGNVLEVITDRKLPSEHPTDLGRVDYYTTDVVSFSDYYPYGMQRHSYLLADATPTGTEEVLVEEPVKYTNLGLFVNDDGDLELQPVAGNGWMHGANGDVFIREGERIEFEIPNTPFSENRYMVGLSYQEGGYNYTTIDYALYVTSSGTIGIYESAGTSPTWSFGAYVSGDMLSIKRQAGMIRYYRNGTLIRQVTDSSPTVPMVIDLSLCKPTTTSGFKIYNLTAYKWQGSILLPQKVGYTNKTGAYITGNNDLAVNPTSHVSWYHGATGVQSVLEGEYVSFEVPTGDINDARCMLGLSTQDLSQAYTSIEYAWYITPSAGNTYAQIYESGAYVSASSAAVQPGDVLRLERMADSIVYKRNGVVVRTLPDPYLGQEMIIDMSISNDPAYNRFIHNPKVGKLQQVPVFQSDDYVLRGNSSYKYGFNSMEKDDEVKNLKGTSYDFGARMYDPRVGRFLSRDNYANKFAYQSPYVISANNPISFVDIKGDSAYLVIWFSKDGETGHAGIAVDNYKQIEVRNMVNGCEVINYEMVPDGTVTYYDLWPESPVGKTQLQTNVTPDYGEGTVIDKNNLITTDPSISGEIGKVSEYGEGRPPDGVVAIQTSSNEYLSDTELKLGIDKSIKKDRRYNACSFNCSSFAQEMLNKAPQISINANQQILPGLSLQALGYKDAETVAPNNLYNEAVSHPNANVMTGPSQVEAKPYLEYFGKSNRSSNSTNSSSKQSSKENK